MAIKRLSVSMPDYIYDQYISGVKNQSAHIVEMFTKGCEYELSGGLTNKSQLIIQMKENKSKDETIRKLNLEINKLKALTNMAEKKEMLKRRKAINEMAHEELLDVFNDR